MWCLRVNWKLSCSWGDKQIVSSAKTKAIIFINKTKLITNQMTIITNETIQWIKFKRKCLEVLNSRLRHSTNKLEEQPRLSSFLIRRLRLWSCRSILSNSQRSSKQWKEFQLNKRKRRANEAAFNSLKNQLRLSSSLITTKQTEPQAPRLTNSLLTISNLHRC